MQVLSAWQTYEHVHSKMPVMTILFGFAREDVAYGHIESCLRYIAVQAGPAV
jgi:hypothetical protein